VVPIVVALDLETNPVASGWITSLARPGGNLTGLFLDQPEMSGKLLQLLKECVPALTKVAVTTSSGWTRGSRGVPRRWSRPT
jgi:putative ABC transport system substrate-binding protein